VGFSLFKCSHACVIVHASDRGRICAGDLIGINTAIYSPSGANSGVGFAIPVDTVKESVTEIIQNGRVIRPVLGIAFAPDASTSQLGVNGILVLSVKENGPASKVYSAKTNSSL
jgi:S1-C subfamily serine protease